MSLAPLWCGYFYTVSWCPSQSGSSRSSPLSGQAELGEAMAFFIYDTPKVLLLLTLVVFAMGVVRSFFSPEHTRALLSGKREGVGNVMAAALGIVTPFCSARRCRSLSDLSVPASRSASRSPFSLQRPWSTRWRLGCSSDWWVGKIALTYLAFGLSIAIVAGWVIGRLGLENWLEDWVKDLRSGAADDVEIVLSPVDRIRAGLDAVRDIVGRVWPWLIAGIAAGAFIHGYVPSELLASVMGSETWWSVPAAILIGIPMYSNAAGIIPVIEALIGKGAAIGTVLAFMMSVIALSLPEMIICETSLKLIAVFVGVVGTGILTVGYLFNLLFI